MTSVYIVSARYVPKPYLEAEAKDSIDETSSKKKKGKASVQPKFDAFTFQGGSAFDGWVCGSGIKRDDN